jgi:xanthine dehydrogenase accessory factor
MQDIREAVNGWLRQGDRVALATVVETWGSSPRPAGAHLAVNQSTAMSGSVSGGCVETAVVSEMIESLADGQPRLLHYGVSDDTAWEVGLSCGGRISIFAEPLEERWWRLIETRQPGDRLVTVLAGEYAGAKLLLRAGRVEVSRPLPEALHTVLLSTAQAISHTQRLTLTDSDLLIEVELATPHLIMVGGAHAAMTLQRLAELMGFRVMLIDPRRAFATRERFPTVEVISHEYPDKALRDVPLNAHTFVAILTHDPKIDDVALKVVLPAPVAYIGILSSSRTHEKRLARLIEAGIDPTLFSRIRTPIGLNIGATTPAEIALSIMAEIIAVRNAGGTV